MMSMCSFLKVSTCKPPRYGLFPGIQDFSSINVSVATHSWLLELEQAIVVPTIIWMPLKKKSSRFLAIKAGVGENDSSSMSDANQDTGPGLTCIAELGLGLTIT